MTTLQRAALSLAALALLCLTALRAADEDDPEPLGGFPRTAAADRDRSAGNLRQLGIAFHNFHDAMGAFPAAAIRDARGKDLLSWRVALLPYVEEQALYNQFKLDEPWDSKNNKPLLAKMPKIYAPAIAGKPAKAHATYYRVFTGPDTLFNPKAARGQGAATLGVPIQGITDGTSNTGLVFEAGDPVPWTKPDELEYDAKKLPKLGGLFREGFHVVLCDGSTRFIDRQAADKDTLHLLIKPSDGQAINWARLPEPKKK